jgi:hypothetical protein
MRTIPLGGKRAAGRVALVDDDDYDLVMQYRWHVREYWRPGRVRPMGPYAMTNVRRDGRRVTLFMHNLIMGSTGIDHESGNGLDNQRSNLRPATHDQNMHNRRPNLGHSSQYKGVTWRRNSGKWHARITLDGKRRSLGYFAGEEDAARAYDVAALASFGEFARPNFPAETVPTYAEVVDAGREDWAAPVTAKRAMGSLTSDEVADIIARYSAGQTVQLIADSLGVWTSAVSRTLRRNGIAMRSPRVRLGSSRRQVPGVPRQLEFPA